MALTSDQIAVKEQLKDFISNWKKNNGITSTVLKGDELAFISHVVTC